MKGLLGKIASALGFNKQEIRSVFQRGDYAMPSVGTPMRRWRHPRGKPRQRLAYPKIEARSIAAYDRAMTLWLDGGRAGPRPSSFVPKQLAHA